MVGQIVFGSPEARAILERDRELRRQQEEEEIKGDSNQLADRLRDIEGEIENLEMELGGLEDEAAEIKRKLKEMARPDPKPGFMAINQWNAWATGTIGATVAQ